MFRIAFTSFILSNGNDIVFSYLKYKITKLNYTRFYYLIQSSNLDDLIKPWKILLYYLRDDVIFILLEYILIFILNNKIDVFYPTYLLC